MIKYLDLNIMERCIKCGSQRLVKFGFTNRRDGDNSQKYKCKDCGSSMAEKCRIKRLSETDKEMIEKMVSEGIGQRKIQRLLGFKNVYTIQNYLKKSEQISDAYKSYVLKLNNFSGAELIIDEIYTYIGNKSNRYYIWTALMIHNTKKYPVFHISKNKGTDSLDEFVRQLPNPDIVYSDKNPVYKEFYGKRNIAKKGIKTNLIESFNAQLRHYCSNLIRKGKSYSKSLSSFFTNIHIIFNHKFICNLI